MCPKIEDQEFQHIQRVLSETSAAQLTIVNWTLGFQSAGLAGFYVIAIPETVNTVFSILLPSVMILISLALGFVWMRENRLAKQFNTKIGQHLWNPEEDCWTGKTAVVWAGVFTICIVFWFVVLTLAVSGCLSGLLKN